MTVKLLTHNGQEIKQFTDVVDVKVTEEKFLSLRICKNKAEETFAISPWEYGKVLIEKAV